VNEALRNSSEKTNPSDILKHAHFLANFIRGFRLLPTYWGKVHRGVNIPINEYAVGKIVMFHGFTSTSKKPEPAKFFIQKEEKDGKIKPVYFEIHSLSGRNISDLSFYPTEDEVVFRPFTSFKITEMKIQDLKRSRPNPWPDKDGGETIEEIIPNVYHITLREIYADLRGRKILISIDDYLQLDMKTIMEKSERKNVTWVCLPSTKAAEEFFTRERKLLTKNIDKLRIITDMFRIEERMEKDQKTAQIPNFEAGIEVVKVLAKLEYKAPILCYTGPRFLQKNRQRFQEEKLDNVFATDKPEIALAWAEFAEIPDGLPKIIPSSFSSSSSSISSSPHHHYHHH